MRTLETRAYEPHVVLQRLSVRRRRSSVEGGSGIDCGSRWVGGLKSECRKTARFLVLWHFAGNRRVAHGQKTSTKGGANHVVCIYRYVKKKVQLLLVRIGLVVAAARIGRSCLFFPSCPSFRFRCQPASGFHTMGWSVAVRHESTICAMCCRWCQPCFLTESHVF